MKRSKILFSFGFFFLFISFSLFAQKEKSALNSFLQSESLKQAGVGLKIWNLTDRKLLLSHNEQKSYIPASTLKLVATASALDHLGKDYRIETPLYFTGKITSEGILDGDLILEGRNDPSFGSQFAGMSKEAISSALLKCLKDAGIRSVKGRIIVDDLSFRKEPLFSPKWMWEDLGNYYAPCVFGISFIDNTYELNFRSESKNMPTKITNVNPKIKGLVFENKVRIINTQRNDVYINGIPYSGERTLSGSMKENQQTYRAKGEIPDPAFFLADWMTEFLRENKIPVSGNPTTTRLSQVSSSGRNLLYSFTSPVLTELITVTNFQSNNHYAEHILTVFEKESNGKLDEYWRRKGISVTGQFLYDGSGLSPVSALSARFLTDILIYMHGSANQQAFYRSLPLAGKEGTVSSFLKGSILEGKARIKSGSMSNVQNYAGYINYESKTYAFAILINNYTGDRATLRKQIEHLLCGVF